MAAMGHHIEHKHHHNLVDDGRLMPRREFPRKVKVTAFQRAEGKCERCEAALFPGKFHYDHVIADGIGGENTLENCAVLCTACHGLKTRREDVPRIAKMKRQRDKHIGAKTPTRNPLPGGRNSKWKKKVDGTVVLR